MKLPMFTTTTIEAVLNCPTCSYGLIISALATSEGAMVQANCGHCGAFSIDIHAEVRVDFTFERGQTHGSKGEKKWRRK